MSFHFFLSIAFVVALSACGPSAKITSGSARPYATPSVKSLLGEIISKQSKARSFLAESRMEYWANGERIKPTVYIMGERGAKVRFNVLSPAGGSVMADLACNGANFQYVDFNRDCQMVGLCNKNAISQLLRISLEPDDFLLLAIGSSPIVDGATGTVRWDGAKQQETLKLTSGDGKWTQTIVLDGRQQRWNVLSSTVKNSQGDIEWKITNKDFSTQTSEDGLAFQLPAKTRFEQPRVKAELSIRWVERSINAKLSADRFEMEIPQLPTCE